MGGSEWESASFNGEFWEGRENKVGFTREERKSYE
jgi:hypothetical protein